MEPIARRDSPRRMQNRDVAGLFTFRVQGLLYLQGTSVLVAAEHCPACLPRKAEIQLGLPARGAMEGVRQGAPPSLGDGSVDAVDIPVDGQQLRVGQGGACRNSHHAGAVLERSCEGIKLAIDDVALLLFE